MERETLVMGCKRFHSEGDETSMHRWERWFQQGTVKTEQLRAGAHMWLEGDTGLRGDRLGPLMHLHDGASELFFFLDGCCRVELGDSFVLANGGDFLFVPPEVPHNLWKEGPEDMRLVFVVAPNVFENKWRTDGFRLSGWEGSAPLARVEQAGELPGNEHLQSRAMRVRGRQLAEPDERERLYLVADGEVRYEDPLLSGVLGRGDFVHVVAGRPHSLEASDALVLEITPHVR